MGMPSDDNAIFLGPAANLAEPRAAQRLNDEGGGENNNETAMTIGARATLINGTANAARFTLRAADSLVSQVASTDVELAAGATFSWWVTEDTTFIYMQAADGASGFTAWVWQSSHGLK
jgi:hypothetical protein